MGWGRLCHEPIGRDLCDSEAGKQPSCQAIRDQERNKSRQSLWSLQPSGSQPSQSCDPSLQSLMLWAPHNHKIILLLLCKCNFTTVNEFNVNTSYSTLPPPYTHTHTQIDPQSEKHSGLAGAGGAKGMMSPCRCKNYPRTKLEKGNPSSLGFKQGKMAAVPTSHQSRPDHWVLPGSLSSYLLQGSPSWHTLPLP